MNTLFGVLAFLAGALTWTMFSTKQMMLGFPCAMFWAILGGYAFTQSTVTGDVFYLLFFASMGMTIFSVLAMYGLRTKKQEIQDGDSFLDERGTDDRYVDEGKERVRFNDDGMNKQEFATLESDLSGRSSRSSKKVMAIRDRADRRRTKGVVKAPDFGEFK